MTQYSQKPQGYMTVGELAKEAKTTVRTLQYYDKEGLLAPALYGKGGRRLYTQQDQNRLRQILIFRELQMDLAKIKSIMQSDDYDTKRVLEAQKKMLELKKRKLDHLIHEIDRMIASGERLEQHCFDFKETEWELVWDEIYQEQGMVQNEVLMPVKAFVRRLKDRGLSKVLDLGCGTGRNTIYMAKSGLQVTATDISDRGLEITSKRAGECGLSVKTVKHDMRNLPFRDDLFDAVLCSWVSGHGTLDDIKQHASEMLRVIKPGGMLFADYPSTKSEHYGRGTEIEKNTFLNNMTAEERIPHHYSDLEELEDIYSQYQHTITPYTYEYGHKGDLHYIEAFLVEVTKTEEVK